MAKREILFRGKCLDDNLWVYGSFVMDALEQKNGLCGVDGFIRLYNPTIAKTEMFEVDRETVGQYTGLKDKNDKMIFEDDILLLDMYGVAYVGVVTYRDALFEVVTGTASPALYEAARSFKCEVIGNIHDDPILYEKERARNGLIAYDKRRQTYDDCPALGSQFECFPWCDCLHGNDTAKEEQL